MKSSIALLVIDMQNRFRSCSRGKVESNVVRLVKRFHFHHLTLCFTRHHDPERDQTVLKEWWKCPITKGSHDWDFLPNIKKVVGANDCVIDDKISYDAFLHTNLEEYLRERSISTVVICGVMTNLCCETTARSAFCRDFNVWFPHDANGTVDDSMQLRTLKNLEFGFASVLSTEAILKELA